MPERFPCDDRGLSDSEALSDSGGSEAALASLAFVELVNLGEVCLYDREEHQLRDPLARGHGNVFLSPVPCRDDELALIVGVDEADKVAEHQAVLRAEPGAGERSG